MSVTQLIDAFLAGTLTYDQMTGEQQLEFQLFAAQGGFRGMSSGTSVPRPAA